MVLSRKQKVVLVTGVFDVLHIEHIRFLEAAKREGDWLVVGIETDKRVRRIKGAGRPIYPEMIRAEQVRAIKWVDQVFVLPEKFDSYDDWLKLVKKIRPKVYAVSGGSEHLETKQQICDLVGTKLTVVRPRNLQVSTTLLLEKLK